MNTRIAENIHWVGHVDWPVRDFHSYETEQGTSYNAYLVVDDACALIDTVKAPFGADLLRRVAEITPLDTVKHVVCNHAEPDHAGSLPEVMAALPNAELVCNKKCARVLCQYFGNPGWKIREVSEADTLSTGRFTLRFPQTPLVHWPESMFTHIPEADVLFSMDAFGQHYASAERFDDESPVETVMAEAKTYYANIVMPYGSAAAKVLAQSGALTGGLIAPSHGVIWRGRKARILDAYQAWTSGAQAAKVLVIYDTMWESTAMMATAVADAASVPGVTVRMIHARRTGLTQIAAEMLDAAAVALGSPTLNGAMMPSIGALMTYLRGLKPSPKAAAAFGSTGWARGGAEDAHEALAALKWDVLQEPIKAQYRPTDEILGKCCELGALLAAKALERAGTA